MFNHFWPLKITVMQSPALYSYDSAEREYIITVRKVKIQVRRAVTLWEKGIILKGGEFCFPSLDWSPYPKEYERLEKTIVTDMKFATEIYDEEDLAESLLGVEEPMGRISLNGCKSKWFPIVKVTIIEEGKEGGIIIE